MSKPTLGIIGGGQLGSMLAIAANKLDIKTKKKILIVNTTYPGIIDLPSQYLDVININTTNHLSGKWTGKRIHNGNRFPATEH